MNKQNEPKRSSKRGCFLVLLIFVGVIAASLFLIGGPSRRAGHVKNAIQTGMNLDQVENLLKEKGGRYFAFYQLLLDGAWKMGSREEFIKRFDVQADAPIPYARMQLTFMGTTPNRVSFYVEFDEKGRVLKVTNPYGWD